MHLVITERTPARRCAYCSADFTVLKSTTCEGCRTHYHEACVTELKGGCGTIGCAQTKPPVKARRERRRGQAVGSTVDKRAGWIAWLPAFIGFSFLINDASAWVVVPILGSLLGLALAYGKKVNHPL